MGWWCTHAVYAGRYRATFDVYDANGANVSSSAPQQLSSGDVLLGKYEIDFALGGGPVGLSYTARVIGSGRRVVVKMLSGPAADPALVQRTLDKLKTIQSDALIGMVDHGQHKGQTFVVMEHFEGESLRRLMDEYAGQRKAFTLQEAAQLVVRVLEAADAGHTAQMTHRQLKPQNILVQTRNVGPGQGKVVRTVKVTGLGLADLVSPTVLQELLTDRPEARYMAPELDPAGAGGAAQADVYSAGVIFYELLTGQVPTGTYLAPSQVRDDLPEKVDSIVDIALDPNAEDRYPTVRDMINDVQRVFTEDAPAATGLPRKMVFGVIAAAVLLVMAAGLAMWVFDPESGARRQDEELRAQVVKENPLPDAEAIKAKLAAHPDMVYIPSGSFIHGRMRAESDKTASVNEPLAEVAKMTAFYVDRFEWPNQKGETPMVKMTYAEAEASCASVGKRLCTANEWERACKGPESLIYGYGDSFDAAKCGGDIPNDANRDNHLDQVAGATESCKSAWGVYDLSGGAREWTSTPDPSNSRFRVVKGGKRGAPERGTRCAYGEGMNPGASDRAVSLRCCIGEGEVIPGADSQEPVTPNP